MRALDTPLAGVKLLEPDVFRDERGFFLEAWNARAFQSLGIEAAFVQDNHSQSRRNVLRGLHYQLRQPQGKLVRVVAGEVFDVVVDLRRDSPTWGQWYGTTLSAANGRMLWIPPGLAHGLLARSEVVDLLYKCTDYYAPAWERTIVWNDPDLAIDWPLTDGQPPLLSAKDAAGSCLADAELPP